MISYKTFLMQKKTSTYEKLLDIKDYPDLFGSPEMLETTTLSNRGRTYEPGIDENEALEFTANYDLETFKTLRGMKDTENDFAVWFGGTEAGNVLTPTGSDGKFKFKGKLSVSLVGKGVNEVREMKITIAPTTDITIDEEA